MFYRYFEKQRAQIKNLMSGYKVFYESGEWVVYDLNMDG